MPRPESEMMENARAVETDCDRAPINSVQAMAKPAIVQYFLTRTGFPPRLISTSANQPPSAATSAMPPKLKNVNEPICDSDKWRLSVKYAGIQVIQKYTKTIKAKVHVRCPEFARSH